MVPRLPVCWVIGAICFVGTFPQAEADRVVDDADFVNLFINKMSAIVSQDNLSGSSDAHDGCPEGFRFPSAEGAIRSSKLDIYELCLPAVVLVGRIYQCGECSKWHHGGFAGGWIASPEGHIVTNEHVVEKKSGEHLGIMTSEGNVYPVKAQCFSDKISDIAVLKIDPAGERLPFLRLAENVKPGEDISVLSHPGGRLWYISQGIVSRFSRGGEEGQPVWMNVTADYAVGSSGCPVLDDSGAVVGMVSRTSTIYTGPAEDKCGSCSSSKRSPQMVVKECVPLSALKRLE